MKFSDDPRFLIADVPPHVACSVLNIANDAGYSSDRVCKGLGFGPDDLTNPHCRLSYRQIKELVVRVRDAMGDASVGLVSGARQTPLSWGLVGVAMMSCPTFREAAMYGIQHQNDAGALLTHDAYLDAKTFTLEVKTRYPDPEFEPFLVEDSLCSVVSVARALLGPGYRPSLVEVAYKPPKYAKLYARHLLCDVRFGAGVNRMVSDVAWLDSPIGSYDPYTCGAILTHINSLLTQRTSQMDLVESVRSYVARNLEQSFTAGDIAADLGLSERTLRRRLADLGLNFRSVVDKVRHDQALQLLHDADRSVSEISAVTGYSDARNFTRAFKRWTGESPTNLRKK